MGACGILSGAGSTALAQQRQEARCSFESRSVCSAKGCQPLAAADSFLLVPSLEQLQQAANRPGADSPLPEIRRCDAKGCNAVSVLAAESGAFINLMTPGYVLKIATEDVSLMEIRKGGFVEAATQMLDALVSRGTCTFR